MTNPHTNQPAEAPRSRALVYVLVGCGSLTLFCLAAVVGIGVWLASGPEGGVRLGTQMDPYAATYLQEHALLEPDETLLAYYDVTIDMDGSEAVILTRDRVLYHKGGNTSAVQLREITEVAHEYESLIGDTFDLYVDDLPVMHVEIAPFNGGELFATVLEGAIDKARAALPPPGDEAPEAEVPAGDPAPEAPPQP